MTGPLEGITVVTLEQAVSAPFATRQLADLGARVIKIERPRTGDFARGYDETVHGMSANFAWLNRSKQSLTLDMKHPRAAEIMKILLQSADVLVQNLAPGAAARLGLSEEALLPQYPRLILCGISGYGESGPYRDKKAYDLLIQGESGLIAITGTPNERAKTGISIADIAAGMFAYSGILTSLYRREKTGKGSVLKISMFEALCEWMMFPLYYNHFGSVPFVPSGTAHPTIYPYGPFPTGDGRTVIIGIQNEREWAAFCKQVIGRPDLAADPRFNSVSRRVKNREPLKSLIEDAFGKLKSDELTKLLDDAEIANSQLNDLESVWNHPQLAARNRWRNVDSPVGEIPALIPPGMPVDVAPKMERVPALGQDTDEILMEIGYSRADVDRMRAECAIG
jgi:itaconate CoA-transferase